MLRISYILLLAIVVECHCWALSPMENKSPSWLQCSDGVNHLAYEYIQGKSPALLFCGGFQSSMLGSKASELSDFCKREGYSFCRFDYRGHGQSSKSFVACTLSDWIEDATDILNHVVLKGNDKVLLVGSSMGAWISLHLALKSPGTISGIVGIASAPDFLNDMYSSFSKEQKDLLLTQGFVTLPSEYSDEPYIITKQLIDDAVQNWLLLDRTISIYCPVRLLHGQVDSDVCWQKSIHLAQQIAAKDTVVTLIKDGDHRLSRSQDIERIKLTVRELMQTSTT